MRVAEMIAKGNASAWIWTKYPLGGGEQTYYVNIDFASIESSGLENWEYGRGDPLRWPRDALYPQKLALTSPTCGGSSVGIVRLRTKTMEFFLIIQT
jgi:hypothetical protein